MRVAPGGKDRQRRTLTREASYSSSKALGACFPLFCRTVAPGLELLAHYHTRTVNTPGCLQGLSQSRA
jgi:hypothetical protein